MFRRPITCTGPHSGRDLSRFDSAVTATLQIARNTVRRYYDHLASVIYRSSPVALKHCPAMTDGYLLFRQQALAESISQSGRYDPMVSVVAVDEHNDELDAAPMPSGIDGPRQWGRLFKGRARFVVFTHRSGSDGFTGTTLRGRGAIG